MCAGRSTIGAMAADDLDWVLNLLGVRPGRVALLRDVPLGNGNWLVDTADGQRVVLRGYHPQTTADDLAYLLRAHLSAVVLS